MGMEAGVQLLRFAFAKSLTSDPWGWKRRALQPAPLLPPAILYTLTGAKKKCKKIGFFFFFSAGVELLIKSLRVVEGDACYRVDQKR